MVSQVGAGQQATLSPHPVHKIGTNFALIERIRAVFGDQRQASGKGWLLEDFARAQYAPVGSKKNAEQPCI